MATTNPSETPVNALPSAPARSQTPDRNNGGRGSGGRALYGARDDGRSGGRGYSRGRGSNGNSSGRGGRGGNDGGGRGGGNSGRGGRGGRGGFNNQNQSGPSNMNHGGPPTHPASAVPYGCLPPFLPGASSLVEQLDQKMLVVLRDGRHLVGTLRTFDQFSNMVLEDTSERRILVVPREKSEGEEGKKEDTICYQADVKLGLYIVRGDSVVLMGEVDDDEEEIETNDKMRLVSLEELEQLEEEEKKRQEEKGETKEHIDWEFDLDLVA